MCESDEFDINVVIKLPFDESEMKLNFEDSSPSYASIEVTEDVVKTFQDQFDIFTRNKKGKLIISSAFYVRLYILFSIIWSFDGDQKSVSIVTKLCLCSFQTSTKFRKSIEWKITCTEIIIDMY